MREDGKSSPGLMPVDQIWRRAVNAASPGRKPNHSTKRLPITHARVLLVLSDQFEPISGQRVWAVLQDLYDRQSHIGHVASEVLPRLFRVGMVHREDGPKSSRNAKVPNMWSLTTEGRELVNALKYERRAQIDSKRRYRYEGTNDTGDGVSGAQRRSETAVSTQEQHVTTIDDASDVDGPPVFNTLDELLDWRGRSG